MLVMFDVTDPCGVHTMTKGEGKGEVIDLKGLLARDEDFVRAAVEALVQAALEAAMTKAIGAATGERSETRLSYCSGYYSRSLITRVGTLELRVPQDRLGRRAGVSFSRGSRSAVSPASSSSSAMTILASSRRSARSCRRRPLAALLRALLTQRARLRPTQGG